VKVSDVMFTSDETEQEIKDKIKSVGQDKLRKWITGNMFDPDKVVFEEDIRITDKGL
jgi:hypothetical protein